MNKINMEHFGGHQLRLDAVWQVRLYGFWNQLTLGGGFWRLYHHDALGAGVILDGRRVELEPDSVYLLPPHAELTSWREGEPSQLYIHFEVESLFGSRDHLLNRVELTPDLAALVGELRELLTAKQDTGRVWLLGFALAAAAFVRLKPEALCELDSDRRIGRICEELRSHPERPFEMEKLARQAGFAPNAFLRRFREVVGSSPYQYCLMIRYARAARLLESSELGIDEIAAVIGVNDRFHFSRMFKRLYGTPPGEYRRDRK